METENRFNSVEIFNRKNLSLFSALFVWSRFGNSSGLKMNCYVIFTDIIGAPISALRAFFTNGKIYFPYKSYTLCKTLV